MYFSSPNYFNIAQIYRRFCDVKLGNAFPCGEGDIMLNDDHEKVKFSRDAMYQLTKMVDSSMNVSVSILDELRRLMTCLNLTGDFSEFSNFYDFVFFMCRENGQKNITVNRAIAAWRLVLAGRFRLLTQWCDFVEKNQRYNISEDTWRQVLAFSRCVHEDLEGYDPEGAWPTLIDDFVEHMYRITGSVKCSSHNLTCNCNNAEGELSIFEDSLPGLKNLPGLKRKNGQVSIGNNLEVRSSIISCKRRKCNGNDIVSEEGLQSLKLNSSKCLCAVEGSLSKGFSGLFSSPRVENQEHRLSYT